MAITLVQSKSATGTSLTLTSATTAGNCLVVCVADVGSLTTPSVTAITLGGAAGNFTARSTASASNVLATIWDDVNCAGGQTVIAVTETNSNNPVIFAFEFSGVLTAAEFDLQSSGTGNSTTWSSGSTATTSQASEAWIGVGVVNNTAPTGPGAPWTNLSLSSGLAFGIAGSQITSSTGTAVYNGTSAGSTWSAAVITIKGAASAAAAARQGIPVPRRSPARVLWQRVTGQAFTAVPAPRQQPGPAPRRKPARVLWQRVTGQAFTAVPAPRQQPGPAARRTPSRAVVQFTPVRTTNPAPVTGTVQPLPAQPAPRRRPARAYVQFTPVRTTNTHTPGQIQPRATITRPARGPARALITPTTPQPRPLRVITQNIVQGRPHIISPLIGSLAQGQIHVISVSENTIIQEWDQ